MKKWICMFVCLSIGAWGCGKPDETEGPVDSTGKEVKTPDMPEIDLGTPVDPSDLIAPPADDDVTPDDDETTPTEIDPPGLPVLDPSADEPAEDDTSGTGELDGLGVVALVARLGDAGNRDRIADRLGEHGKEAVAELVRALEDDDRNVRRNAAFALGTLGSDAAGAVAPLRKLAEADDDENVRHAALFAVDAVSGN